MKDGFNSSHSYSVALDSLYGAYLKANYPLEYYAVVLNIYQGNTKKVAEIEQELGYFGIKVAPVTFGKSRADYGIDYDNKTLYKGVQSIKYLNSKVSEELYQLSQRDKYQNGKVSYLELFIDIMTETSTDSRQMKILINLDYFRDFGPSELLLNVWKTMCGEGFPELVDEKYADKRKNPLKYSPTHTDKTKEKRLANIKEYIQMLEANPPVEKSVYEKLQNEIEYIGYGVTTFPEMPSAYVVVIGANLKYTPILDVYQLNTGRTFKVKIKKNKFYDLNDNPILKVGNIIKILKTHTEYGKMKVDGKWQDNKSVTWRFIDQLAIVS